MKVKSGYRDITVYVCFRPFKGDWIEKNETVLNGIKWQDVEGLKIKFVCWPDEIETVEYAQEHGYECVVIPWYRHYLFPGPQKSFKFMFETILMDCDSEIFVYINGDIILGPNILKWLKKNAKPYTLYSLPRYNWKFRYPLTNIDDFKKALRESTPEAWTALDFFGFKIQKARKIFIPTPPFLLTAGSMDSWIVAKAGDAGWKRSILPVEEFYMLHIEHEYSHPLKDITTPEKYIKWAFNCGVYAASTQYMSEDILKDTSLKCFEGITDLSRVVEDRLNENLTR